MALKKDAYETSKLKTGCAVVIYVTKNQIETKQNTSNSHSFTWMECKY
jgi:hypothetical protein